MNAPLIPAEAFAAAILECESDRELRGRIAAEYRREHPVEEYISRAWDKPREPPAPRPTPIATIEAMSFALRDGLSCLADPDNLDRFYRIDADGMAELVRKLSLPTRIGVRWTSADIENLATVWEAGRK